MKKNDYNVPLPLKSLVIQFFNFFNRRIIKREIITPMMLPKEYYLILDILKNMKSKICLEWGSGYSTIYFPKKIENIKWISIEHDKEWYSKINRLVEKKNLIQKVDTYYIPPNNFPWTDYNNDGSLSDLRDYILFPDKLHLKFNFILIDGRARKFCLNNAPNYLEKEGIVVLHDANRNYYQENFDAFKYALLLNDERKGSGGLFIGSNTFDFRKKIDLEKHILNWKKLSHIERCLFRINFS